MDIIDKIALGESIEPSNEERLSNVSEELGVNPEWVSSAIQFESKWNPNATNPLSGAKGLIQFTNTTAKEMGYENAEDLAKKHPTIESQISGPVKDYLKKKGPFKDERDFYLSIFYPAGRNLPDDTKLPDNVRKLNPGINTVGDYVKLVKNSVASGDLNISDVEPGQGDALDKMLFPDLFDDFEYSEYGELLPQHGDMGEEAFQNWYNKASKEFNLDPNPDAPEHFYDYRSAFKAGAWPDETGHWPSEYKLEGHPRMVIDGVNTKTGERHVDSKASGPLDFESKYAIPFQSAEQDIIKQPTPDVKGQEYAPSQVLKRDRPETLFSPQIQAPESGEIREQTGGREIPAKDSPIGALTGEAIRSLKFQKPDVLTEQRMKDFPVETVAGEIAGQVVPAFAGGAGLQKTLLGIPQVARLASAGKWGKTAFSAVTRSVAAGTDFAIRSKEELTSTDPVVQKKAIGRLATVIAASAASPLPEEFLPKGYIQPFAQAAADLVVQVAGDKYIGEDSFSEENIVNTIAGTITSGLFALNDIRKPNVAPKAKPKVTSEAKPEVDADFVRPDTKPDVDFEFKPEEPAVKAEQKPKPEVPKTETIETPDIDKADVPRVQTDTEPFQKKAVPASSKTEPEKTQKGFSGGNEYASAGEYAKRQKKPSGIQLPEIVEIAKGVMQGKYPAIVKKFRNDGVMGLFRAKKGDSKIEIKADIFEDMEQAEKTVAHEIGHAVDYFPEETMKRGNVIGRIKSLKNHGKEYIAGFPDGPEPLSNAEKRRLRKLAERMLSSKFEKEIDEEIIKRTSYKPEDVLAIWNSLDKDKIDPKLYDYIANLNTADKKSIILEAMKGKVSGSIPAKEEQRIKTGKKIKIMMDGGEATPESIAKKYRELFEEEIKKRQLLVASKMKNELWEISNIWRPIPKNASSRFIKYRKKGEELYADAISVLLNEPELLAEKAPMFYRGFFSYMDSKPEMKKAYEAIQARMEKGGDAIFENREKTILKGFEKKEEQRKAAYKDRVDKQRKETVAKGLYRAGLEKYAVLEDAVKSLKKAGIEIPDDKNPFLLAKEKPYVIGKIQAYTEEAKYRIKETIGWGKDEKKLLGLFMFARRASGERAKMANPEGIGGKYAEDQLSYFKKKYGEKKYNQIKKAADDFSKLRQEDIIPVLTDDNTFNKELINKIKNNDEYARFSVVEDFQKKYGKNITGSILGIKKQSGTLRAIGNPFIETVINDAMLLRAKHRNDWIRSTVEMLKKNKGNLPYQIEPAEKTNIRGIRQFKHVESSDFKTVYYLEDGKLQAYNVDRQVADLLNTDPVTGNGALNALRAIGNVQRSLFVKYAPGFLTRNPVRDIKAFARNIPEANLRQAIRYTFKAMPEVWDFVKKGKMSDDIRSALKEGAMPTERIYSNTRALDADDELERLMSQFTTEESKKRFVGRQLDRISNFFEILGQMEEKSVKVGGYKFLKEKTEGRYSSQKRADLVRTRIGTPDVYSGGTAKSALNNLFIFSNANLQGVRAAIEAFKQDKAAFVGKAMLYDVAPKALMTIAEVGLLTHLADRFGLLPEEVEWLEDAYKLIPGYHKARGNTIPLPFRYEDGRQPYFMIPQDYTGQALGAIFYRTLKAITEKDAGQIPEIIGEISDVNPIGQAGLQPVLELASTWWKYANGKNPIDSWTNRPVISEQVYGAGAGKEIAEMLKWSWDQVGGSIIYKIPNDYDIKKKGNLEKIIGAPYIGSIPSAFIKVSDRGVAQLQAREAKKVEKQEKLARLDLRERITNNLKNNDNPDRKDFSNFFSEYKKEQNELGNKVERSRVYRTWKSVVARKYGSGELKKIYYAPTLRQREALVDQYLDRKNYQGSERRKLKRRLMDKSILFKEMINK